MIYHNMDINDKVIEELFDNSYTIVLKSNDSNCDFEISLFIEDVVKIAPIIDEYGQDGINALVCYIYRCLPMEGARTPNFERALQKIGDKGLNTPRRLI